MQRRFGRAQVLNPGDEAKALSHHSPAYRPEIDGLRAVAVLAVLITHIHPQWLPGGFLGVDLFFVISCYVVTAFILRRQENNYLQMLAGFYARRFRRLIPALLLMVAITSIIFCSFAPQADDIYNQSIRTGLTSIFGLSNLYLWSQGNNYFDFGTQFNPFLHTWSLGVEEQFYLVWPILVLLCTLRSRGSHRKSLLTLLLLTIFLATLSLISYLYLSTHSASSAAFYLMPTRFWELSAGAIVFLAQRLLSSHTPPWQPAHLKSLIQSSLIGIILAGFIFASEPATGFKPAFVAASAGFLACLRSHSSVGHLLSQPPILALGISSYSLYLWHWPLIVIARWTVGLTAQTLLPLLVAIALATIASYRVETRFRFGSSGKRGLQKALLTYPLLSLATGSLVYVATSLFADRIYLGLSKVDPQNFSVRRSVQGTSISTYRCFLEPTASARASQGSPECLAITKQQRPTIFLEGDSISHSLLPLLETLHSSGGYNVSYFGRGGCALPFFEPWAENRHLLPRFQGCREHAHIREDFILSHIQPGDRLLLVTNTYVQGLASEAGYQAAMAKVAEKLQRKQADLILFSPLPVFTERTTIQTPLSLCSPEWYRPQSVLPIACKPFAVDRNPLLQGSQSMRYLQHRLQQQHSNIHIFAPFPILCPAGQPSCSTHRQGVMLFNDRLHLTPTGAKSLAPAFQAFLQRLD